MLSSEDTAPSTPPPAATAHGFFSSDDAVHVSSPPSSPPEFPWEQEQQHLHSNDKPATVPMASPLRTAFSILGKRKPLATTTANPRIAKKARVTNRTTTTSATKPLTQMQISAGQRVQVTCLDCGMEYVASSTEDRKLHDIHHKQYTEGYDVGRDFVHKARDPKHVFPGARAGDQVYVVDWNDSAGRKKRAQAVLEIVQKELGAVPIEEKRIWTRRVGRKPKFTAYMYVRGSRCVGFLLVERITMAMRVVESDEAKCRRKEREKAERKKDTAGTAPVTTLSALHARRRAIEQTYEDASDRPIQVSPDVYPHRIGVSRIWTCPTHRGKNISRTLLDTALAHHEQRDTETEDVESASLSSPTTGQMSTKRPATIRKEDFAFSQPTEAGARLARRWFGKVYGWGVYVD